MHSTEYSVRADIPQGFTARERAQARMNIRAAVMPEPVQAIVYGLDLLDLLSSSLPGSTGDESAILITKTATGNWSSDGNDTAPLVGPWLFLTPDATTESVDGETEEGDEDYPTESADYVQWLVTYWDDGAQDTAFDWRSEILAAELASDLFVFRYWTEEPNLEDTEWEDDSVAAAGGMWIQPLDPAAATPDPTILKLVAVTAITDASMLALGFTDQAEITPEGGPSIYVPIASSPWS
jgi:hypothetical protein